MMLLRAEATTGSSLVECVGIAAANIADRLIVMVLAGSARGMLSSLRVVVPGGHRVQRVIVVERGLYRVAQ